jgi:acetyltransferase-like isoleucine patch superfamily enzyme
MIRILGAALAKLAMVCPGGASLRPRLHRWRGATIGRDVWIGLYVSIDELHPEALTIGDNCTIGIRTTILTHFYWGPAHAVSNGSVVIEDDVFIGPHTVILPNVRIGRGAVIQAGSVISTNVPARTLWGPAPAVPLASVGTPLTRAHGYQGFLRGLKPHVSARD